MSVISLRLGTSVSSRAFATSATPQAALNIESAQMPLCRRAVESALLIQRSYTFFHARKGIENQFHAAR
jgi:hypothetical protein